MAEDDLELKIEGISDKKIEAIFLIFYSLIVATSPLIIVLIILSLFFCLLFYTRLKRFFQYGKAKTLQTFLLYELANTNIK